jgi:hypothetical protein
MTLPLTAFWPRSGSKIDYPQITQIYADYEFGFFLSATSADGNSGRFPAI